MVKSDVTRPRGVLRGERAAKGDVVDWTAVALDLGYFDQAHFIRDFKKLVGRTPGEYGR